MKTLLTYIIILISLNCYSQKLKVVEDESGLYGYVYNASWGNYFVPRTFMYCDQSGYVAWNQHLTTQLIFKDDKVIASSKLPIKIESVEDAALLLMIGQLPIEWEIKDLDGNRYVNDKTCLTYLNSGNISNNTGSYKARFPSGIEADLHIHLDWKQVIIWK